MPISGESLVSIVTPTFNAESYLEQAIKCVRAQRYKNWEHIVVDGGSSDGTLSILRKYERQGNLRWSSEADRGVYDAANKGFRSSQGEIQCILPADDVYLPWTLETVVKTFERNSDADIVYGDGVVSWMGEPYARIFFNPPANSLNSFCQVSIPNTNPFFWKRRVFEELGGYNLEFKSASDYDFLARASSTFNCSKVKEALSIFRYRRESVAGSRRTLDEFARISARLREEYWPSSSPMLVRARRTKFFLEDSYADLHRLSLLSLVGGESGAWANLINSKAISKLRLGYNLLTALLPGLLGRNPGSFLLPGYVDTGKLLKIATFEGYSSKN